MGFGSYDESEQQDQDNDFDEDEGVNIKGNDGEGDISFESDASQDELINQLQDIKETDEE